MAGTGTPDRSGIAVIQDNKLLSCISGGWCGGTCTIPLMVAIIISVVVG